MRHHVAQLQHHMDEAMGYEAGMHTHVRDSRLRGEADVCVCVCMCV